MGRFEKKDVGGPLDALCGIESVKVTDIQTGNTGVGTGWLSNKGEAERNAIRDVKEKNDSGYLNDQSKYQK